MRLGLLVLTALGSLACWTVSSAQATVNVAIDLSHQRMHIRSSGGDFDWPISSARSGFSTPRGSYAPTHLELMHYSRKYHMSPMPHAIFFRGGYAIHGTYSTASLGRPASHGCVRLSPGNATTLYNLVRSEGARISISGTPPASRPFYASVRPRASRAGSASPRYGSPGAAGQDPYGLGGGYAPGSGFLGLGPSLGLE